MGNLTQLSDRVFADIVRSSLSSVLGRDISASNGPDRFPQGLMAIGSERRIRKLLVVREVASLLQCHPETIYRQIKTEGLPAKRHGAGWKFDSEEVAEWLEERTAKRKKPPPEETTAK